MGSESTLKFVMTGFKEMEKDVEQIVYLCSRPGIAQEDRIQPLISALLFVAME